jgi:hypothetical protein
MPTRHKIKVESVVETDAAFQDCKALMKRLQKDYKATTKRLAKLNRADLTVPETMKARESAVGLIGRYRKAIIDLQALLGSLGELVLEL